MSKEKDIVIEKLFVVIQQKKEEIKRIEKPDWITNCSFVSPLQPALKPRNLRVISDISELVGMISDLLVITDYHEKACVIAEVEPTLKWNGHKLSDWVSDVKTRISVVNIAVKKKSLEALEARLDKLVSKEKREEMELAAITKELEG